MKNLISLLFILAFYAFSHPESFSQGQFQLTIGGTNNEFAYSMIQTADGGYAVAGYTESFGAGAADFYIVKFYADGTIQWTRTAGGTANDYARAIIQSPDGGFIAAGYSASFGAGGDDIYIIKLDADGVIQWTKTIGGAGNDKAYSMVLNSDGGFTLACASPIGDIVGDAYIIKLDAAGEILWSKTIGDANRNEYATCLVQCSDGGYAFAGYTGTATTNSVDYYIVKIDADGTPEWNTTAGGTAHDYAWAITQTSDGGYAVTGYCQGFGAGASDIYVVKLNSGGAVEWTRTVGGTGSDVGWSIKQLSDGSYIIAGQTSSYGAGGADIYIVKLNSGGVLQWTKTVGGTNHDIANCLIQTSDGGFAAVGTTYTISGGWYALADINIVKFNGNWKTCSNNQSPKSKSGSGGTFAAEYRTFSSQEPVVISQNPVVSSGGDLTMLCSRGNGPMTENELKGNIEPPLKFKLEQNYPNPFNPKTNINFQLTMFSHVNLVIYDNLGNEIETLVNTELNPGTYEVNWDAVNYPSGVYYYKLTSGNYTETKRMVLIK